jgi:transposase-like protein
LEPGASVSIVARRHDLNANMLFTWRRQIGTSTLLPAGNAMRFVPAAITTKTAPTVFPLAGRIEIVLAEGDRIITGNLPLYRYLARCTSRNLKRALRCAVAFDFLLHSLAANCGARAICVILSGTWADAVLG